MKNALLPPKISIVIPVYNVENYLAKCLDSCIEQTLFDIEIVCIDDGSTDRSPEILDMYAEKDFRIKVYHKKNAGVSAARNDGIKYSTGKWIMFVDSDDYLDKYACEVVWRESITQTCEIIVHGGFIVPDYPKPESWKYWAVITRPVYYPEFTFGTIMERGGNPFLWLQAYSRELLERTNVRFNEDISFGEDLIFQFQVFPFAKGVSFLGERVYFYRWYREGSLMKASTADLDARTSRHISNVAVIAEYWKEHGLFEKFGKEMLGWALGFVIPDLEKLELKDPGLLADQLKDVLTECGLVKYKGRLDHIGTRQFNTMMKLAKE